MKLTPREASRSMFGVMARGVVSKQPIQSFMSSTARNSTFGFESSAQSGLRLTAKSGIRRNTSFASRFSMVCSSLLLKMVFPGIGLLADCGKRLRCRVFTTVVGLEILRFPNTQQSRHSWISSRSLARARTQSIRTAPGRRFIVRPISSYDSSCKFRSRITCR